VLAPVVDRNGRGHEIAVGVAMAGADFRELTGPAGNRVLVTIRACSRVKHGPQPRAGIMVLFKTRLVEGIGIAGGFGDAVADAL